MDVYAYSMGYHLDLNIPESPLVKTWFPAYGAIDKEWKLLGGRAEDRRCLLEPGPKVDIDTQSIPLSLFLFLVCHEGSYSSTMMLYTSTVLHHSKFPEC